MAKLPVTDFIKTYQQDPKKALKWTEEHEIESISWTQIFKLGKTFEQQVHDIEFIQAHNIYRPIDALVEKSKKQIEQLSGVTFEKNYELPYPVEKEYDLTLHKYLTLAKVSDSLIKLLNEKAPEKVISLFESITQLRNLAEINKPMAAQLILLAPKTLAALITTQHQLSSLSPYLQDDLSALTDSDTQRFAGLYQSANDFIQLIKTNPKVAHGLMLKEGAHLGGLITDRTSLMALVAATNVAEIDAWPLIKNEPARFASLFETPDQFKELININNKLAGFLIVNAPLQVAALFSDAKQFTSLASLNINSAACLIANEPASIVASFKNGFADLQELVTTLKSNAPYLFASAKVKKLFGLFFKQANQFTAFTALNSVLAEDLLNANPDTITALFTTAEELIDLAQKNPEMATAVFKHAPDACVKLFNKDSQFNLLAKASAPLAALLIDYNTNEIVALFKDYDSLIRLMSNSPATGIHLFAKSPNSMANLFNKAEQVVFFVVKYGEQLERILFAQAQKYITTLFAQEQFIKLLEAKDSYTHLHHLVSADTAKFAGFLENKEQFLLLASRSSEAAGILLETHPEKISAWFDTEEKQKELEELSPSLYEKLTDIQNKWLIAENDCAFYLDVFAILMGIGGAALLIVGLIAASMATVFTGVFLGGAGLAVYGLFNKGGLFPCYGDTSKPKEDVSVESENLCQLF